MSFRIEIALNLKHHGNIKHIKDKITEQAYNYGATGCYINYEYWGIKRTINRNHIVFIIHFPELPGFIINFLSRIKCDRSIYIESIGFDDTKFTLLYASKKYLNMMDKDKVKEYLNKTIEQERFLQVIKTVH
jgi:hypothetical protein